jgi:hypothetical protein
MIRPLVLAGLLLAGSPAFAADPVGHYLVEGTNPGGGGGYSGSVDVTRTGDTYRVVWTIAGQRFIGTAIGGTRAFAVSYRSGNETGLAIYTEDAQDWSGSWTYAGGNRLGTERWVRN